MPPQNSSNEAARGLAHIDAALPTSLCIRASPAHTGLVSTPRIAVREGATHGIALAVRDCKGKDKP